LKTKCDVLEIQCNTFKDTYGNDNNHIISEEDYKEFDMLRREKDENEAMILKLQSNDLAKCKDIEILKKEIDDLKKNKY